MKTEHIDYYMKLALMASSRSTCLRRKVGCVIVKNDSILATGINGSPRKQEHCASVGCYREKHNIPSGERHELCRGAHAETNAIAFAARNGVAIDGAVMVCTTRPCVQCIKSMINSGIYRCYYLWGYPEPFDVGLQYEHMLIQHNLDEEIIDAITKIS